jgi:carboxypeptidase PM20D1
MGKIGKGALVAGVLVAGLVGTVAVRTALFKGPNAADLDQVALPKPPRIDTALAAEHLSQAVQIPTISHQDKAQNDPAQWDRLHAWLQTTYPAAHKVMQREIVLNHTLIYTWQGSDPSLAPIILMAHQDVVPISEGTEGQWKHAPFSGAIAEGAVWGRGSVDDKGSLVGLFEAAETLIKTGFVPKRTIYIVSGEDEEAGGAGARAAAAALKAKGVKALFTLDEGSVVISDNPVTGGPATLIGVAEKGYGTLRLTAKAAGGHSSAPPKETAVVALAKAVTAIAEQPFPIRFQGPGADMLMSLAPYGKPVVKMAAANTWLFAPLLAAQIGATPTGAAMMHTTIAPTMLQGSPKENVLPQEATARINYRIAPWDRAEDVMARAKTAIGDLPVVLTWETPPREPSPVSSTRSEGWKLVAATARAATPGAPVAPSLVIAGTDSRSMTEVSADVYRFQPIVFAMDDVKMIHGTNEHISLTNLNRMVGFYAQLMMVGGR